MHHTRVRMRDGAEVEGLITLWRPAEGWFELAAGAAGHTLRVELRYVASAVTEGQRVGRNPDGTARIEDRDELARAREDGWDGK